MLGNKLIPHFVADRPMSLRILSGLDIHTHPVHFGLMLQACGSENYRNMVSRFPCLELEYCSVIHGKCPYNGDISRCNSGQIVKKLVTTIADSGVFTKNGSSIDYNELFARYQSMGVERGIIFDELGDCTATIVSAKKGLDIYSQRSYSFQLLGVTQGRSPDEYLKCYEQLVKLGFTEIAIGGLLTKKVNTARYAHSNKEEIEDIVKKIKSEWNPDRLFVLGVYNPKRHEFLENLGVHAADYKGWIFQYTHRFPDPHLHHLDRILQTQSFIEKNIFSRMSGKPAVERSIHNISISLSANIQVKGRRVYVKNGKGNHSHTTINQIVVISCGKTKKQVPFCESKEAYLGKSFLMKRKFAEATKLPWFILSAKYGLLRPETIINPNYDKTIKNKNDINILANVIQDQFPRFSGLNDVKEIVFLGPISYLKSLRIALNGNNEIIINHLTEGLNQGKALQKIKKLLQEEEQNGFIRLPIESTQNSETRIQERFTLNTASCKE
ncbi:MAG: hypothetical protein IPI71_09385 [Methanolinea sp.]|nr:MAG: hypothetical protein IPI71_09385 [Methanolinea sp.]